ncbi:MAG TPA: hypothetical protein PKD54_12820, partial [Pirellulaceae bacterium]|nr:hypothetical protein [Pirellulaceae bacterium]
MFSGMLNSWTKSRRIVRSLTAANRSRGQLRDPHRYDALERRQLLAGLPTLIDILAGAGASEANLFTNVNNTVFFRANDGASGLELWKSDGTSAGTTLVKDIRPGSGWANPSELT